MQPSSVGVFLCCFLLQQFAGVAAADVGAADYIAIGTSLALTAFILIFLGFFLCRAQLNSSGISVTKEMGRDNPAVSGKEAEEGRVQAIRMATMPPTITQ